MRYELVIHFSISQNHFSTQDTLSRCDSSVSKMELMQVDSWSVVPGEVYSDFVTVQGSTLWNILTLDEQQCDINLSKFSCNFHSFTLS